MCISKFGYAVFSSLKTNVEQMQSPIFPALKRKSTFAEGLFKRSDNSDRGGGKLLSKTFFPIFLQMPLRQRRKNLKFSDNEKDIHVFLYPMCERYASF